MIITVLNASFSKEITLYKNSGMISDKSIRKMMIMIIVTEAETATRMPLKPLPFIPGPILLHVRHIKGIT